MHHKRLATRALAFLAGGLAATMSASIASAHIEPDPIAIEGGKTATVTFSPEHGCDGSPTISLAFQLPASVTDATPVDKPGWTAAVDNGVITFAGGSLPASTEGEGFAITFTAPAEAGTLVFPTVQTCEQGVNNWIDPPNADGSEPEAAAPTINVTNGPPTAADLTPAEEGAEPVTATPATSSDDNSGIGLLDGVVYGSGAIGVASLLVLRRRRKVRPG